MTYKELLLKRQSDRKYSEKQVEKEKLDACLEALRLSPSACNSQPWSVVVVKEAEQRAKVAKAAASLVMNRFMLQAPVIVAVVLEKANLTASVGAAIKDKEYALLDVGIAANNFCMQAAELGLGTCMVGWFDEKKVKRTLGVSDAKRIPLLISLGYSLAKTREKIRKPIEKIVHYETYK